MPLDTQTLCRYRLERAAEDLLTAQHNHQSGFYKASIQSVVQRRFRKTVEKCQIISRYFKNVFAKKEIRPETCLSIPGLQFYLCSITITIPPPQSKPQYSSPLSTAAEPLSPISRQQ